MVGVFSFINDDALREMLERDKKELDVALERNLSKTVLVMSGSIIEAILVDYFLAFPLGGKTKDQILKAGLENLVDWANQEGLLSNRAKELSSVIRGFRNLIHPGKEYRLEEMENINIHSARIANSLIEIIVQEVSKNYAEKLGYTSQQAIKKVNIDPASYSIFPHMVDKMTPVERVKLFRTIPVVCAEEELSTTIQRFVSLHDILSKNIPEEVIKEEVQIVYENIQHKTKDEVMFSLRFYMDYLNLLDSDKKEAVITYVLSLLKVASSSELKLWRNWNIGLIGKYLNEPAFDSTLHDWVRSAVYSVNTESEEEFLSLLESIFVHINYTKQDEIEEMLRQSYGSKAKQWAEAMNSFMPF